MGPETERPITILINMSCQRSIGYHVDMERPPFLPFKNIDKFKV